ncbi:late embryogenesis abundant protein 47-like [Salvia miltiorrhiza]|uniref:late embryogenesis abundant protein 47-like n=1 Tax=Salvia miltiorrhiza TaxID=226208 RepID=UPI0025AC30C2|nr:late embryogenesis abundant protein 47-like [Salvia miltiorrhiza]
MSQEQPVKHVLDTIRELNAQEAASHVQAQNTSGSSTPTNPHSNAVASQKEPVGVQGIKEIQSSPLGSRTEQRGEITIGEALEATALTAGHRPVDYSDAAAIQAAEVRATGRTNIVPGGVAAAAQSAATRNARLPRDEDKTKLGEILSDASSKLPSDKPVTRRDAEGVIGAELRNDPNLCTRPGGVAASVAAAARLNQTNASHNNQNKTN